MEWIVDMGPAQKCESMSDIFQIVEILKLKLLTPGL
jgi:hypothetical protein